MTSESKNFVDGLFIKERNERTPEFILAMYSININKFKEWLTANEGSAVNGWLNIDIKKSKAGKKYAELNAYKPDKPADTRFQFSKEEELPVIQQDIAVEDIPF